MEGGGSGWVVDGTVSVNNNPLRAAGSRRPTLIAEGFSVIVTLRGRLPAWAAWGQASWFALLVLVWSGLLLSWSLDPDYTAGELLDHLQAWRESGVLYPPLGSELPVRVLNYPPLVLLLARILTEFGAPALLAGRLVNALGLLAVVAGVAWWTRGRGARGAALAGTVGLMGASFPVLYGAGQFHVELWAAAGTVWGFGLLFRANSWKGAALGGLVLALGCFAKQTQVVPSMLALIWIWVHRRPFAPAALAAYAATGALGASAITAAWGVEAWLHMVLYTVGMYSVPNLGQQALSHLAPWSILLAFTAHTAWLRGRQAWSDPALWYWGGALIWSLSASRIGSGYPYFLDVHIATAICVGPRIFRTPPVRSGAWGWLLAIQIVGANLGAAGALTANAMRLAHTEAELPALCARLSGEPRLIAEEAGLTRACGLPTLIHPFITTSLAAQGRWNPAPFEQALRDGDYPIAVLPFDPRGKVTGAHAQRWTKGELAAFRDAPVVELMPTGRWAARW